MFCPQCGNANQQENSYCRSCGLFLPDFEKLKKAETTPEQHLKANLLLNFLTAIVSLTLAVLLYYFFLGKENTPVIIYVTAGFLIAIFGWQVQIIIRTFLLKNQLKKRTNPAVKELELPDIEIVKTNELLNEADSSSAFSSSISENSTRKFSRVPRR